MVTGPRWTQRGAHLAGKKRKRQTLTPMDPQVSSHGENPAVDESDETASEEEGPILSQEESQNEEDVEAIDEGCYVEELMAASTTIRYTLVLLIYFNFKNLIIQFYCPLIFIK